MTSEAFNRLAKSVPMNSIGWFDLFDRSGVLAEWLNSPDSEQVHYGILLLTQPAIIRDRDVRVAEYVQKGLAKAPNPSPARNGYLSVFALADFFKSEALFSLFLAHFKAGDFDGQHEYWWTQFHNLPEIAPHRALQLLEAFLDRRQQIALSHGKTNPFDGDDQAFSLPSNLPHRLASLVPKEVVAALLPRVVPLVKLHGLEEKEDGLQLNSIWPFISQNPFSDFKYALLNGLLHAMELLAQRSPSELDEFTGEAEMLPHRTFAYLLMSAWSANGKHYGTRIISYLLENENRFDLGFDTWGTGNGISAISRAAVKAAAPEVSPEIYDKLESAILTLHPPVERKRPQRFGLLQFLLLSAIGEERLSNVARKRFQELSRKFGDFDTSPPSPTSGAHFVPSPIPQEAVVKMTNEQWLAAMRTYQNEDIRDRKHFLTGGAVEVSRQLANEARHDKERFARLALEMGPEIPKIYYDALVGALVAQKEDPMAVSQGKPAQLTSLPTDTLVQVFRHIHELPGKPCGRWLCTSIGEIPQRDFPDDILEMVSFYCKNDPDPEIVGVSDQHYFGGDLVQYGINTTRGAAAQTIADLILAAPKRWALLKDAVLAAITDPALIVRATAVSALIALLRIDRDRATDLLLDMLAKAPELRGTMFVLEFVNRRAFADYSKLRDLLLLMLKDEDNGQRETAAGCIAAASLGNAAATSDLDLVWQQDEFCRAAVAMFAAQNFSHAEVRDTCREWLIRSFNDESRKVRDAASTCFNNLPEGILSDESRLMGAFIDSASFEEHAYSLLRVLEGSASRLPDVVLKIPEKAIALHQADASLRARHARWWTNDMASLVLKLYEQTTDESLLKRCLDALDRMIELNFGSFAKELEQVDRS